jgi:hypothetical protein
MMMRGNQDFQGTMFGYISLEESAPAAHPLRKQATRPFSIASQTRRGGSSLRNLQPSRLREALFNGLASATF